MVEVVVEVPQVMVALVHQVVVEQEKVRVITPVTRVTLHKEIMVVMEILIVLSVLAEVAVVPTKQDRMLALLDKVEKVVEE